MAAMLTCMLYPKFAKRQHQQPLGRYIIACSSQGSRSMTLDNKRYAVPRQKQKSHAQAEQQHVTPSKGTTSRNLKTKLILLFCIKRLIPMQRIDLFSRWFLGTTPCMAVCHVMTDDKAAEPGRICMAAFWSSALLKNQKNNKNAIARGFELQTNRNHPSKQSRGDLESVRILQIRMQTWGNSNA